MLMMLLMRLLMLLMTMMMARPPLLLMLLLMILMILPTFIQSPFVHFLFVSRENGAQNRHCRLKNRIFPFSGKPGFESGIFRDAIVPSQDELKRAKFHRAAFSRLACRP